jgi:hypothetical protein
MGVLMVGLKALREVRKCEVQRKRSGTSRLLLGIEQ